LLKVTRQGRDFRVVGEIALFEVLQQSLDGEQLAALGLGESDHGRLVLNIEGAVWRRGDLLLGLKQPRAARGAIIWRLKNPERLFATHALDPDQLSLYAYADLRTAEGRPPGSPIWPG
jgi:hypothetical protein